MGELRAETEEDALYVLYDVLNTVGCAISDTTTLLIVSY